MILVSEKRDDRTEWGDIHTYIADSVEVSRCRGVEVVGRRLLATDDKEMANPVPPHKIGKWQGTPARSIVSLTGTKVLKSFHTRPSKVPTRQSKRFLKSLHSIPIICTLKGRDVYSRIGSTPDP